MAGKRRCVKGKQKETRALPGLDQDTAPAAAIQAASLAGIADLFAVVVPRAADIPG